MPEFEIRVGHTLELLRATPAETYHCVVTSPPYFGLRKYEGVEDSIWGGEENCEHVFAETLHEDRRGTEGSNLAGRNPYTNGEARINYPEGMCQLCGAWRGVLGNEPTVELYVEHMVALLNNSHLMKK